MCTFCHDFSRNLIKRSHTLWMTNFCLAVLLGFSSARRNAGLWFHERTLLLMWEDFHDFFLFYFFFPGQYCGAKPVLSQFHSVFLIRLFGCGEGKKWQPAKTLTWCCSLCSHYIRKLNLGFTIWNLCTVKLEARKEFLEQTNNSTCKQHDDCKLFPVLSSKCWCLEIQQNLSS